MNTENLSTEEKLNQLDIPFVISRLSDVSNGTYVWFYGERWQKVKSGKKTTKVIKVDNISNHFCVAMELP